MVTADDTRALIRADIAELVQSFVQEGYPRMIAYDRVASHIGRSPAWIQRILGRDEHTTVGWHDHLNIRAAYDRLCARVEAAADALEAHNDKLELERTHAVGESIGTATASNVSVGSLVVESRREGLNEGDRA